MSKTLPVRVVVILASVRPSRRADEVRQWWSSTTRDTAASLGVEVQVADLRVLDLAWGHEPEEPHTGRYSLESTRRWAAVVGGADAFVIMTPEHNHSLPASLKHALDLLGPEWSSKPVAWVSYGNTSAGTRALASAKQVTSALGMVNLGPDVSLRLSEIDEDGQPALAARADQARAALSSVLQHVEILRSLRREAVAVPQLPPGYVAHRGDPSDAAELLVLQRACWVDEALANQTLDIGALHDDLETVRDDVSRHESVMVRRGARLVASVQAWSDDEAWRIGRLMVAPDHRRRGLARALLRFAESEATPSVRRIRLHTGAASEVNLRFYESEGFIRDATTRPGQATLSKSIPSGRPEVATA